MLKDRSGDHGDARQHLEHRRLSHLHFHIMDGPSPLLSNG